MILLNMVFYFLLYCMWMSNLKWFSSEEPFSRPYDAYRVQRWIDSAEKAFGCFEFSHPNPPVGINLQKNAQRLWIGFSPHYVRNGTDHKTRSI